MPPTTRHTPDQGFEIKQKNHTFIVRPTKRADIENLNEAYNKFTGRERSLAQLNWQWFGGPAQPTFSWLILDKSTNEIIGHHGIMPLIFCDQGKPVLVGKTENTFVQKGRQKQVPYLRIESRLKNLAIQRFDYIFTTASRAGDGAVKQLRNFLKYEDSGSSIAYGLKFNRKTGQLLGGKFSKKYIKIKWLGQLLGNFVPLAMAIFSLPARLKYRHCKAKKVDWSEVSEVEKFWSQHKNSYGLTPNREQAWLNWRFANNPSVTYVLWKFEQKDVCIGYAVTRKQTIAFTDQSVETDMIEDIFVAENARDNFTSALVALVHAFDNPAMMVLTTLDQDDALNQAAKNYTGWLGSFIKQRGPEFLALKGDNPPPQWYFTNCYSEGGSYEIESPI